jgi:hypothetical protein
MGYTYLASQYHEENPMQDLIQNYVNDLHKLREVFHKELEANCGRAIKGNGPLR